MKKLTEEQITAIGMRWACGVEVQEAATELGHSMSTISKYYAVFKAMPYGSICNGKTAAGPPASNQP